MQCICLFLMQQAAHQIEITLEGGENSTRNAAVNGDGFGVAWYDFRVKNSCALFKTIAPV